MIHLRTNVMHHQQRKRRTKEYHHMVFFSVNNDQGGIATAMCDIKTSYSLKYASDYLQLTADLRSSLKGNYDGLIINNVMPITGRARPGGKRWTLT